jgi:alpha-methylacyl-CoA racemase
VGPLKGVKVVEIASIGPGPFCAMMLADMGADVIRIERKDVPPSERKRFNVLARGRRSIALDLKQERGVATVFTPGRAGRRSDRGVSSRRHGASRTGPRCLPRTQQEADLRSNDGWGQTGRSEMRPVTISTTLP